MVKKFLAAAPSFFRAAEAPRKTAAFLALAAAFLCIVPSASAQYRSWGSQGVSVSSSGAVEGNDDRSVQIASDTAGGLYVLWLDTGGFSAATAGHFNLYATHYSSAGVRASGWPSANNGVVLVSNNVSTNTQQTDSMDLVSDNAGGFVAAWTPDGNTTYVNRVNSSGAAVWSASTTTADGGSGGIDQGVALAGVLAEPKVSGDAVFVLRSDMTRALYMNALSLANGAQHSGFSGLGKQVLNSTVGQTIQGGDLASSPAGSGQANAGVLLVGQAQWSGTGVFDLDMLRVDTAGAINWTSSVTTNGAAALQQNGDSVRLAADGAGGAFVVWLDTRPSTPGLYHDHYDVNGSPAWAVGPNGVRFAPGVASVNNFRAAAAGTAGYAVTWSTTNTGGGDAFAQLVTNNGASASTLFANPDLGPGNNPEPATLLSGGAPTYLLAISSNGFGAQGAVQAYDASGAAIFSSTFPLVFNPPASHMNLKHALGVGGRFAVAWVQDTSCNGPCTGGNLFVQTIATAPVAAPGSPVIAAISSVTLTATWTAASGATGYELDVSTDSTFSTGVSSVSVNSSGATTLTIAGLLSNATYFASVGSLATGLGPTHYAATTPAAKATLAVPLPGRQLAGVFLTSATANWLPLSPSQAIGYRVEASTDPNFSPGAVLSSVTFNLGLSTLTVSGLTQNTTYFLRAGSLNVASAPDYGSSSVSTATLTLPPLAGPFTAIGANALTANWTQNGNPAGTAYLVQISTMGTLTPVLASSQTANISAAFSSLTPNTTYFAQVAAYGVNTGTWTAFTPLNSTSTLANAPASVFVAGVGQTSASLGWSGGANPAGTLYVAQVSTNNFQTVLAASNTLNTSATFGGLASNTTFFLQVEAVNNNGVATAFAAASATSTMAAPPLTGNPSGVGLTSLTENWGANNNSATTLYTVQLSTNSGFAPLFGSSQTVSASVAFSGLSANTTYYAQVQALGNDGSLTAFTQLGTTTTLLSPPAAAASTFTTVGTSSFTANWAAGLNGPGTVYVAQIATNSAFSPVAFSSTTQNLSVLFGTGGAGSPLTSNATHYFRVQSTSPGNSSPFLGDAGTFAVTLAALPTAGSPTYTSVTTGTLTVNWSSGSAAAGFNAAGSNYLVQLATTSGFAVIVSSAQTASLNQAFSGLTQNSTYFAEVAVYGRSAGAFGPFASLASTGTTTLPPSAPALAILGASSATVNWTANGNPAGTVYYVQVSSVAGFSSGVISQTTTGLGVPFTGLISNTTYFAQAAAYSVNTGTWTAFAQSSGGLSTLAAAPSGAAVTSAALTALSVAWTPNNPAGTIFIAQISTNNFQTVLASSVTQNASASFGGLASNTTFFAQVEAVGNGGVATSFAAAAASSTMVAAPLSAAPSGITTSSITVNWLANGNSAATLYTVQLSTDSGFGALSGSSQTLNASATFSGLSANTAFFSRVRALGNDGSLTAFTPLPSTTTLLLSPALAGTTFASVNAASVTVQWANGGNGPGTTYVAQISTDNFATVNFSSTTQNLSALFGAGGAGPSLVPNTTYYFQVQSATSTNASAFLSLGSTDTLAAQPQAVSPSFGGVTNTGLSVSWSSGSASPGFNPAGTLYLVQISTVSGFGTLVNSSTTANTSAGFSGLTANTTYFAQVSVFSRNTGSFGAFTSLGSTATTTSPPGTPALTALGTSSMTVAWTQNGNPAGTVYSVQVSSVAGFSSGVISQTTTSLSVPFTGLISNTTYFAQAAAFSVNTGTWTAFAQSPGLATLAAAPTGAAVTSVGLTSLAFGWTANNPAGTAFVAQISTNNFQTVLAASATLNASASFSSLPSNATFFLQVEAVNYNGVASAFNAASATSTMVAAPLSAPPSAVAAATITVNWLANGNSATTLYTVQLSTDSGFGAVTSSQTLNTSATFSGLSANTAFFSRVRALGNDGTLTAFTPLPSTTTLLLSPALAGTSFANVNFSSITVQWASGGNGAGTTYVAQISTDNFATVNFSSTTQNLSVLFGAGGAGPALVANTTYYFQVQSATATNASAFVSLGSTDTLAFAPTGTLVTAVTSTTVTLAWNPNGNPVPGTNFEVWRDVSNTFPAPVKTVVSTAAFSAGGLSPSTTYFFQVRTFSNNGTYTAFDTVAPSTATLPPAPGLPGTPAGVVLGVSSVSWTWSAASNSPSFYDLFLSSSGNPAVQLSTTAPSTSVTLTGLSTNTAYGLSVAGVNATGIGIHSSAAAVYTMAMPPAGTTPSSVFATSATVSWSLNTNPPATFAEIWRSTDNFAASTNTVIVASGAVTTITSFNLLGCTPYFYKVRNFNGLGIVGVSTPTAFDSTVSFTTQVSTPSPAVTLSAVSLPANQIALSWTQSPDSDIAAYRLYSDSGTGTVSYSTPVAVLTSTQTSYTAAAFTVSSAAYTFALRAVNRCGTEEKTGVFAVAASSGAVSTVRAFITAPNSGRHIFNGPGASIPVAADLLSGTPAQTQQVTFQFQVAGSASWTNIPSASASHPNPATSAPYDTQWDVSGIAAGTQMNVRAVALSVSGSTDTAPAAVTVTVDTLANADLSATASGGNIQLKQIVNTAVANTIIVAGINAGDPQAKILLPAGAFSGSTVAFTVTAMNVPTLSTTPPSGFTPAGSVSVITLPSGFTTFLSGGLTATVTLSYSPTVANPSGLIIESFDPTLGWQALSGITVDTSKLLVSGQTPHFSLFAVGLGVSASSNLSSVRTYPVPYKPNGGVADQGGGNTGIFFDNLPQSVTIKIYTVTGQQVVSFGTDNSTGKLQWDARNDGGKDVATGLYIAVISSPGMPSVTKKLLIIR